ncbi:sensor histidine kinase [Noviherbaspirillum aerium]|uniref:sensor histidine kinase n=1 Tax=Noviherbaspirillum aerium TaxID=2588497 RepID=UPI00178C1B2E|nr:ATP-binding protein [Noviherbaspirillum aerium]
MTMRQLFTNRTRLLAWLAGWLLFLAGGVGLICRFEFDQQRRLFETDSRIAHRLLTQRTVQHDTILATLSAGGPNDAGCAPSVRTQVMRIYPQLVAVLCSRMEGLWDDSLRKAEAASRRSGHAEVAGAEFSRGRYWLVQAGEHGGWALQIDMRQMIPRAEWPGAPLQVQLRHESDAAAADGLMLLQPGPLADAAWQLDFSKHLSSDSQPFSLIIRRGFAWSDLPLAAMASWAVISGLIMTAAYMLRRQLVERRRAESLLRLRRVERLNTLGELSAGVAHELNQPLTAILANCQAARRLLGKERSDAQAAALDQALGHAIAQAKRASAVISRLRSLVEQRQQEQAVQTVALGDAVRRALHLLEPELQRRHTAPVQVDEARPVSVPADPVALDQILHNLLLNALQAMDGMPVAARRLRIHIESGPRDDVLRIADNGPGIPAQALPRLFEPFYTTRENGLGLGLTLCETLAGNMNCAISAANGATGGAEFSLRFTRTEQEIAT